jgi:hypothetical protein
MVSKNKNKRKRHGKKHVDQKARQRECRRRKLVADNPLALTRRNVPPSQRKAPPIVYTSQSIRMPLRLLARLSTENGALPDTAPKNRTQRAARSRTTRYDYKFLHQAGPEVYKDWKAWMTGAILKCMHKPKGTQVFLYIIHTFVSCCLVHCVVLHNEVEFLEGPADSDQVTLTITHTNHHPHHRSHTHQPSLTYFIVAVTITLTIRLLRGGCVTGQASRWGTATTTTSRAGELLIGIGASPTPSRRTRRLCAYQIGPL